MAKIALSITVVLGLVLIFFGYQAKEEVAKVQQEWKKTRGDLTNEKADHKKTQGDLKDTKETLAKTQSDLDQSQKEVATLKGEVQEAKTMLTEATTKFEDANAKLTAINNELEQIKAELGGVGGIEGIKALVERSKQQAEQLAVLEKEKQELEAVKTALTTQKNDAEGKLTKVEQEVNSYRGNVWRTGLEGQIVAYNKEWNFVVLNIGDRQGARPSNVLVVKRGAQAVGRVKVTTVEPAQSIADIVPGSVRKGDSLQPGDTVVFEAQTSARPAR